jgi:membrane-associated phospholipid phosphatase
VAPQVLASLVLTASAVVLFLANFLIALGEPTGTPGNERMLQFLAPADGSVAAILIVAVALVALFPSPGTAPASRPAPSSVRSLAGFVAGALAAAAFVRAIVVLTIAHQRVVLKLGSMVEALAAAMVAAVAAYWALKPKLPRPGS